jgi:hypothetical protein
MLSRRGFFGALAALTVAPRLRSLFPVRPPSPAAAINRATFSFWRSQQTAGNTSAMTLGQLRTQMRDVYARCERG